MLVPGEASFYFLGAGSKATRKRSTVKPLLIGTAISGSRQLSTSADALDTSRTSTTIHGLHGVLNGVAVFTSPAAESCYNVISARFAKHCGLSIRGKPHDLVLANGRKTRCLGRTTGNWSFRGEIIHNQELDFLVLPECTRDVVLGHKVLQETQTLNTNWHRLEKLETYHDADAMPCTQVLGHVKHRIVGTLEKKRLHAVPGTGSEVNILSEDCLRERGLLWLLERDTQRFLKLIDGSEVKTVGQVRAAWRFGRDRWPWQTHIVTFDVLSDCPHDVVLGQKLLFESFAYICHAECFVEHSSNTPSYWQPMRSGAALVPAFMRLGAAPKTAAAAAHVIIKQEMARRAIVDSALERMPVAERLVAEKEEQERRQNFLLSEQKAPSSDKHILGGISDEDEDSHGLKRKSFLAAFAALRRSMSPSNGSDDSDDDDHIVPTDY
jgi:hypothetical protein